MKNYSSFPFARLPLPTLHDTCTRIAKHAAPLVQDGPYQETVTALNDFSRPNGEGELLQNKLQVLYEEVGDNGSWLSALWEDASLATRDPLVPHYAP